MPIKSKVEISQSFVAFSEYINFITYLDSILNDLSTTYVPDTTNVNKEEKEKEKQKAYIKGIELHKSFSHGIFLLFTSYLWVETKLFAEMKLFAF